MKEDKTLQIVNICLKIDLVAQQAYFLMATLTEDQEMKDFWLQMSREEDLHIAYWQRFRNLAEKWQLPEVFENPDEIIYELESIIPKAEKLLERFKKKKDLISSITLSYRLEYYLLHPDFEVLLHFLGSAVGTQNPEDTYEHHINHLIELLNRQGETSSELELLGETLQRLWKENKRLAHQVATDSLTNVHNRRGFFTIATHMAHLTHRQRTLAGVMMMDIDNFKNLNDTYGHQVGDIVLKEIARVIAASSRISDIIGRYGGEEFCVFMPDIEADSILQVAERIRLAVFESRPNDIAVSISIGVVYGKISSNAPEDLHVMLQQADDNLYKAKREGKNKVILKERQMA